jgi:hypothetical protein
VRERLASFSLLVLYLRNRLTGPCHLKTGPVCSHLMLYRRNKLRHGAIRGTFHSIDGPLTDNYRKRDPLVHFYATGVYPAK